MRTLARPLLLACLLPAALPAQRGADAPCRRPAAKTLPAVVTLVSPASYPCRLIGKDLGIELRADAEGKVASIGQSVARDSRGRYYSAAGFGSVDVWGPDGKHLRTIGREGEGPGEFAKGSMLLMVDPQDNLYVRDNQLRWSLFSPAYVFLRAFSANGLGIQRNGAFFLAPFTLVSVEMPVQGGVTRRQVAAFHVFDFSGKAPVAAGRGDGLAPVGGAALPARGRGDLPPVARTFGPVPESEQVGDAYAPDRAIADIGGGRFWAGPPEERGRGYVLELWDAAGTLRQTIRREVPWFRKGSDTPPPKSQSHSEAEEEIGRPRPPTAVIGVRGTSDGLLLTMVRVTNDKWDGARSPTRDVEGYRAMVRKALEVYVEVIDTRAGTVLASDGPLPISRLEQGFPAGWFREWSGYRMAEDSDGLPMVKMMEMRLVAKP